LVRSASRPPGGVPVGPSALRAYAGLLALTLLNPLTVVLLTALVVGRGAGGDPAGPGEQAAFVAGVVLASAAWQILLAAGGAALGHAVTGRRGRALTGRLSAVLLVALALRLVLTA
ncbi:MAG: Lysine exporter protein, partial [Frankiales bacterium]|nr:Lysine exporter protein [Frankiales bacterium]